MTETERTLHPFWLLDYSSGPSDLPVPDDLPYFHVGTDWRFRIIAVLEDGTESLELYNEQVGWSEAKRTMRKPKARVALRVAAERNLHDGSGWQPLPAQTPTYMTLDNLIEHIPLPELPEGLELDPVRANDIREEMLEFLTHWQNSGWGKLFGDNVDATKHSWPNAGYISYLIRAIRMEHQKLATVLGVSDRTMRSWQDVFDPRSITYPAQYALETMARKALMERGSFHD